MSARTNTRPSAVARRRRGPARPRGTIAILLVEDQAIDRAALHLLLESRKGFSVVAVAASADEAVRKCRTHLPDVLILDSRMAYPDGADVVARLCEASPATRILAIAERGEERCMVLNPPGASRASEARRTCLPAADCLQLAVARGAHGALRRSADPEDLFRAVRALAAGQPWYESETAARMVQNARAGSARSLSERERLVAARIADGHSNKEIASELGIGLPTVKKHVGRLLAKLGLQDRLQAGLYLARNPLVLMPQEPSRPSRR